MSVLVKGMEMPKTCKECSFGYEEDAAWMACIPQGVSVRKESVSGICEPHCPLVEVPPHGRLIDADALNKAVEDDFMGVTVYDVSPSEAVSDFQSIVDRQPTIQPEERTMEEFMYGQDMGNPEDGSL